MNHGYLRFLGRGFRLGGVEVGFLGREYNYVGKIIFGASVVDNYFVSLLVGI